MTLVYTTRKVGIIGSENISTCGFIYSTIGTFKVTGFLFIRTLQLTEDDIVLHHKHLTCIWRCFLDYLCLKFHPENAAILCLKFFTCTPVNNGSCPCVTDNSCLSIPKGIIKNNFADEIILNPKEIARQYIRTWFLLDLLSSLPLDYIYLILHDNEKFTQFVHAGEFISRLHSHSFDSFEKPCATFSVILVVIHYEYWLLGGQAITTIGVTARFCLSQMTTVGSVQRLFPVCDCL